MKLVYNSSTANSQQPTANKKPVVFNQIKIILFMFLFISATTKISQAQIYSNGVTTYIWG
jgi:hypothetical protein